MCARDHFDLEVNPALAGTSGSAGAWRGVRLQDRLSVSNFVAGRGVHSTTVRSIGRSSFYDCLAALLESRFHPFFIPTFIYFAAIIHQEDKARRGKSTVLRGRNG